MSPRPVAAPRPPRGRRDLQILVLICLLVLASHPAWASGGAGGAMPWEDKLTAVADSITGPVAKAIGVICIALTGLGVAFSEGGSWVRRGLSVIFGLSIAFTASSFAMSFFNATSGAAF
jgi:type IV secretory pathway VirB2 component (pilin)